MKPPFAVQKPDQTNETSICCAVIRTIYWLIFENKTPVIIYCDVIWRISVPVSKLSPQI